MHDSPAHHDLQLDKYGVEYIFPRVKKAYINHNGYFLHYQDIEATAQSIARVFQKDADTYRRVARQWLHWYRDIILPDMYSAPTPPDIWEAEIRRKPGGAEFLRVALGYSPLEYANELFESDLVRIALVRGAVISEYDPATKGIPSLVFATMISWFAQKNAMVRGGTRQVAEGIRQVIEENGGKIFLGNGVQKIIVENNTAKGVILDDGREFYADRFVASSVNPVQTFLFMIDESHLPESVREKAANFKFKEQSIFRVFLCLKERPLFTMAEREPDLNHSLYYTIGYDSPTDMTRMMQQANEGLVPDVTGLSGGIPTIHDPSQAPPGFHTAFFSILAPFDLADGGPGKWNDVSRDVTEKLLAKLREYAPNVKDANIIGKFPYTPVDIEACIPDMMNGDICQGKVCPEQSGFNRPWAGMSQYRTCIDGLYLCGASSHPGGLAVGGPGYNAANAIAEDLKIEKWWPQYDATKIVTI
ncbi:phytoene desaturase family protein [Paraburkholderia dipogonis]|nr:NAD(P)/FAD-dependent oxidoreductase [Paraburkholderia dipogonis]